MARSLNHTGINKLNKRSICPFSAIRIRAFRGRGTDLRPSSLRLSMPSGLRLSARVVFLISLAVCFLPRLCSACRTPTQLTFLEAPTDTTSDSTFWPMCYSDLGQEASEVSSHVGEHFLLLGILLGPLLCLFVLFPLSLLLTKSGRNIVIRARVLATYM